MRATFLVATLLVLVAALSGCGNDAKEKKTPIDLKEVPPEVMKVAKENLPDVTFERAMKKPNGEYEVIGKNKAGKVREIDITPEGKVTDIE